MEVNEKWKYCVAGNIKKYHYTSNGELKYGTLEMSGGTKVYLWKWWEESDDTVLVIGLGRNKHYRVLKIPVNLIENVRVDRVYTHRVVDIMNNFEFYMDWWDNDYSDMKATEEYVRKWNDALEKRKPHKVILDLLDYFKNVDEGALEFQDTEEMYLQKLAEVYKTSVTEELDSNDIELAHSVLSRIVRSRYAGHKPCEKEWQLCELNLCRTYFIQKDVIELGRYEHLFVECRIGLENGSNDDRIFILETMSKIISDLKVLGKTELIEELLSY